MSFYNLIFGENPASDAILATLGLARADCGRFRDCFISNGEIAVYTRNGGGNRQCWEERGDECTCPGCIITDRLPRHPCYLRDEDDAFDCTYATVYFRFPDEFSDDLKRLDSDETFEPSKRWLDAIESIKARVKP